MGFRASKEMEALRGALFILLLLVQFTVMHTARAEGGFFGRITGFFGDAPDVQLPRPDFHLPRLDIVPFWTDEMKIGRSAYARGEYDRARKMFLRASDDGNIVADWYLGHMYRLGHGVPIDPAIAYSYFTRVADQFTPDEPDPFRLRIEVDAKIRAADYLRLGIPSANLRANPQEAARTYLQMATAFGHPRAFYGLGVMSIEGDGMRQNPSQGLKWLNAAIRKHSAEAAAYMGDLYAKGGLVPQDDVKALMWYIVAAGSASKDEDPQIFQRLMVMQNGAKQETKLEAAARAGVWKQQNPTDPRQQ
jgi:uncharacterized protein